MLKDTPSSPSMILRAHRIPINTEETAPNIVVHIKPRLQRQFQGEVTFYNYRILLEPYLSWSLIPKYTM